MTLGFYFFELKDFWICHSEYRSDFNPLESPNRTCAFGALTEDSYSRVARWHPRIPNRPEFGIQAACLVSTFLIWYPAKIWHPLQADLVSN